MSLRLRLVASVTLVLLLTLACGSVLIYWHAIDKVETEMRAAIGVGSRIAQNAVDDAEETQDPRRRLELLVADFDGDRHLKATLIDANGLVGRVSRLEPPVEDVPGWLQQLLARNPDRIEVKLPRLFDGHGRVVLANDALNEIGEVWEDAGLYLGILSVFSVLVLVATVLTVGKILTPLNNLQAAFSRMGGGTYEARVTETGPPEIMRLCKGFNEMGERLQDMDERTRKLRQQLDKVQEEERADLARDLHDDVSPLLFSVDVDASIIRRGVETGDMALVSSRADAIREAVAQAKRHVRSILGRLRPAVLLDLGLPAALESLLSEWRARHPEVEFKVDIPPRSFGARIDGTLHHLIRESVSNALRHARPKIISIVVHQRVASAVFLEVSDDGGGFDVRKVSKGFGVRGMHERTAVLGGTLSLQNRLDVPGVTVLARLPFNPDSAAAENAAKFEAVAA